METLERFYLVNSLLALRSVGNSVPWFLTFFVEMRFEGRQSPRRHIQTRDSVEGEGYQIVQTDKTNILIRPVPRRLNAHNHTLFSLPRRPLFCVSSHLCLNIGSVPAFLIEQESSAEPS